MNARVRTCVCTHMHRHVHTHMHSVMSDSLQPHGLQPAGVSVRGSFQARILEQGVISCSRGSSQPRDRTLISCVCCTSRLSLYHCTTTWEALVLIIKVPISGRHTDFDIILILTDWKMVKSKVNKECHDWWALSVMDNEWGAMAHSMYLSLPACIIIMNINFPRVTNNSILNT